MTARATAKTGFVGDRYVLSDEERAGIAADLAALPKLTNEALDDIAAILANIRRKRRRVGDAT